MQFIQIWSLTEKSGFKPLLLRGMIQKFSVSFKLHPFKAEPIQNPKSKIQNRLTASLLAIFPSFCVLSSSLPAHAAIAGSNSSHLNTIENSILAQEPSSTPEPTPSPSPEPTPTPTSTPEASPSPSPEPTPTPTPTTPVEPSQVILDQQGELAEGDSVLGSDGSLYDEYTFEGQQGQEITITLESTDFDTYLAVFTPDDKLLGEHDDISQNNSNSQITVTLPAAGTYRVIVNAYDDKGKGKYQLQIK